MALDPLKKNNVTIFGNVESSRTLVFGHGFGTDQTAWRHVAKEFESDYRIITYDNVGGGKADPRAFNMSRYSTYSGYATDLIDLCAALNVQNAYYVGHSASGMIGLLASKREPSLFSKLVFVNASPRYLNDTGYTGGFEKAALDQMLGVMANSYFDWIKGFAPMAMDNPDRPELTEEFTRTLSALRPDVAFAAAKVIFESDHRKEIVGFDKETLIIQSIKDIAVPAIVAEYLHSHLPNSTLHLIDVAGHFPHISEPEVIINELKGFL